MLAQPPDPKELTLWASEDRISKDENGVRIDVLSRATGPANLVFATHVLITALKGTARYKFAKLAPIDVVEKAYCTIFLPKGMPLQFFSTDVCSLAIIRLPEGLFRRALRGVANYDSMLFRAFRDSEDKVLMHATELLRNAALDESPMPPDLVGPLLGSMVNRILRRVEGAPHRRSNAITAAHVAVLDHFIDQNVMRPIRLPELADLVALSVFHFSREFKITTNTSPMRYVLERRVALAKKGLNSSRPLAEVALDYGFSSQSHFTTAFKLVTGMTPSAWRSAC